MLTSVSDNSDLSHSRCLSQSSMTCIGHTIASPVVYMAVMSGTGVTLLSLASPSQYPFPGADGVVNTTLTTASTAVLRGDSTGTSFTVCTLRTGEQVQLHVSTRTFALPSSSFFTLSTSGRTSMFLTMSNAIPAPSPLRFDKVSIRFSADDVSTGPISTTLAISESSCERINLGQARRFNATSAVSSPVISANLNRYYTANVTLNTSTNENICIFLSYTNISARFAVDVVFLMNDATAPNVLSTTLRLTTPPSVLNSKTFLRDYVSNSGSVRLTQATVVQLPVANSSVIAVVVDITTTSNYSSFLWAVIPKCRALSQSDVSTLNFRSAATSGTPVRINGTVIGTQVVVSYASYAAPFTPCLFALWAEPPSIFSIGVNRISGSSSSASPLSHQLTFLCCSCHASICPFEFNCRSNCCHIERHWHNN